MFSLNKQLGPNEQILFLFRPSRRAYLHYYVLFLLILLLSSILSFYSPKGTDKFVFYAYMNLFSQIIFFLCIVVLIRLEWRIWSRRYALTNKRVMYSRGIFSETFKSASYSKITDINLTQSFWDKIMKTGSIGINTAGTNSTEIRYRKVHEPITIKNMITEHQ